MADFSTLYVDGSLSSDTDAYNPATRSATTGTARGYKTLNSAINALTAGGTIYVRQGTYSELGTAHTCFEITKNMTLQAYNSEAVTLTYPLGNPPLTAAGEYGRIIRHNNNVTIDGFTIIGTHDEGDSASQNDDISIVINSNGQGTIKNCTFQKWGHAAIKFGAVAGAVVIEKNLFQAGGFDEHDHHIYISVGNAAGTTIRHNAFTGSTGYAIHLYDRQPVNAYVYGNVINANGGVYTPTNGGGILLGGTGHKVYNNTIVSNTGYGGIVFWKDECTGNDVKNNIIRDNTTDVMMDAAGTNTVGYNNKATLTGSGYDPGGTDVNVDPQFAGSPLNSWDDYRLTDPGSPMIDAGADVGAGYIAILDPAQTSRPAPKNQGASRDIGAFTT